MDSTDLLHVERLGGFGGFGLPGSHLKSQGQIAVADLPAADRRALQALFDARAINAATPPDGFRYRITRRHGDQSQTIEVPESRVPAPLRNCVRDTLD